MRAVILLVLVFAAYTQAVPTCALWCGALFNSTFISICGTSTPNFNNEADCNSWCSIVNFTVGFDGETGNNTLGCRIYHAEVAMTGAAGNAHCDHASMMGGTLCGSRCEAYCHNMMYGPCVGAYADMVTCMAACSVFPTNFPNGGSDISANNQTFWANNVQCRDYHGGAPSLGSGKNAHCAHAWVSGGNACGDACTGYCQNYLLACTGSNRESGVTDQTSCETKCNAAKAANASFVAGIATDYLSTQTSTGDNLKCRIYHSIVALAGGTTADTHCPHAWIAAAAGSPCGPPPPTTPTPVTPTPTPVTSNVAGLVPVLTLVFAAIASKFF